MKNTLAEPESRQTKSDAPSQESAPIARSAPIAWSETPIAAATAHGLTAGDDAATRAPALLLLNQVQALSYVTVAGTPTYRAIVQVFFDAKQRYTIEMRPAELLAALRESGYCVETTSEDGLEYYLGQLVAWGNLARSHDTTAVARIEDFYRKRFLFGLTSVGEAAHRAVLDVEATVGKSGSLQSSMLLTSSSP